VDGNLNEMPIKASPFKEENTIVMRNYLGEFQDLYEHNTSQGAHSNEFNKKVDKTQTIIGIDLQDDILLGEFKQALGEATRDLSGLMSADDKKKLDTLRDLLGPEGGDSDAVVNTIREVLDIFQNYPEGVKVIEVLNGKVDKIIGKGLSTNDFTDEYKNKVDTLDTKVDDIEDNVGEISSIVDYTQSVMQNRLVAGTNILNTTSNIVFENEVLYQERKRGWEAIGEVPIYLRKDEIGTNRIGGSAIVGDEIFWIGGTVVTARVGRTPPLYGASNKNISYNLKTNTWKENLDLPIRKDSATLVAVGTDIYILGSKGRTNKFYPFDSVLFVPDYKYDTITNTYEELNSLQDENYLYVSVQSSGADHLDGKIYISGSYWLRKEKSTGNISMFIEPRLAIYDIATNTWTLGPTPPMSNQGGSSKIVNRKFYVYRNTFHYYDIDTETWSEPLNVSGIESRSHTSMAVRNGLIYVIGGYISGSSPSRTSGKTYVYDPILNEWEEDVDLLLNNDYGIGIGYVMAAVWNDRLVVFGGTGFDESKYDYITNVENEFPNWYVFIERFKNEKDLTIILDKAKDYTDILGVNIEQSKQDKLTAGDNITIDENNVISASGVDLYLSP
ncbi:MAG TPA: hypothetical protein GX521_09960, partial [Firmicutes bacterium]|nr:hypothetical protein [Bacillota bacterium]